MATDRIARLETALLDLLTGEGFTRIDPPILQPVKPFLELSGEDVRRRIYLTRDPTGRELCLRPDFTIPVALAHAEAGGGAGRYAYLGPVFRHRAEQDRPGEIPQGGAEWYGDDDPAAADAAILALAMRATAVGGAQPRLRIGDISLAAAFLDALDFPGLWRRRLWRQQGRSEGIAPYLDRLASEPGNAGAFPALSGLLTQNGNGNAALVIEEVLRMAGVEPVGGRGPHEIAERFVEKAVLAAGDGLEADKRALLAEFHAISGSHDRALDDVRGMAETAGLDLSEPLARCAERGARMAEAGLDMAAITFDCGFTRPLDYYTGLVFDIHAAGAESNGKLAGGGRYDALMTFLGAAAPVPAVGVSVWLERLAAEKTI